MSKEPPRRRGNRRIQLFNEIADELNFYEWHMVLSKKLRCNYHRSIVSN